MSIASYNDLIVKIPQWAERQDISADVVSDFINFIESDINAVLRVPAMENTEALTVSNGRIVIPFDFLELRRLTVEGSERVLQYVSWDQFVEVNRDRGQHSGEDPLYFSRQGQYWYISPVPGDGTIVQCHYYRTIPPLTPTSTENWMLQMCPQLYLYGGLKQLFEYVMDEERAAYWDNRMQRELSKLQAYAEAAEYRGTILTVRPGEF